MSNDIVVKEVTTTAHTDKWGKLKSAQKYTLDFTDVERDELIEYAVRSIVIDLQSKARSAAKNHGAEGLKKFDEIELSVRDMLDNKPQRRSTAEKLAAELSKLSEAERDALLAQLNQQ